MNKILLESKVENDKYTEYIYKTFDIQNKEKTTVEIPFKLEEIQSFNWNLGVIYGGSGSGKTSILKRMGEVKDAQFDANKPLISNFSWLEPKDATLLLTSIGLSSVPTWLRPFRLLSNGEQYRAKLAYLVASAKLDEIILIDEYTSVVDRDVARAMSYSLQKYIRRNNKRIILASCHYDIMEWLTPDWIYSPILGRVERPDYLRGSRPQIELQIYRGIYSSWDLFKKHHYLTNKLNNTASIYICNWNNKPVGIVAVLPLPSGTVSKGVKGSRTVILPDYQGLGIGSKFTDIIAGIYKNNGFRYFTKTVNPALGEYRNKSINWKPTSKNGKTTNYKKHCMQTKIKWDYFDRPSYCHEYIGKPTENMDVLIKPIEEFRRENQFNLFF